MCEYFISDHYFMDFWVLNWYFFQILEATSRLSSISVKMNLKKSRNFSWGFFSLVPFIPNPINPLWIIANHGCEQRHSSRGVIQWKGLKGIVLTCEICKFDETVIVIESLTLSLWRGKKYDSSGVSTNLYYIYISNLNWSKN